MADVNALPGVFEQIGLVAGLRWRTLKNGMRRKNNRWDLIGMIFAAFFSALLVLGVAAGVFALTFVILRKNQFNWFAFLFWAIFLWWQLFPIFVAGFGVNFEFRTLLRFPLSRRAFYLLGIGYGLADFAAISAMCWLFTMLLAALIERPSLVPILLLVSALFVLVAVTLERFIGSALERLLAKRKSRELFLALFILLMISSNFINLAFQRYGPHGFARLGNLLPYLAWLPPSLAGTAVAGWARADYRHLAFGIFGLVGWLVACTAMLWARYSSQYRGEEISESAAPAITRKKEYKRREAAESLTFIPRSVLAVAAKDFRYMTRNGFAALALILPPFMVLVFSMQFAGPNSMLKEKGLSPEMFYPAFMGYLILILVSPAYNSFAYEGKGIQTYFMSPITFREVLMGKNLFLVTLVFAELLLCLGILVFRIGLPTLPRLVATIAAGIFAVASQLAIANWASISFPKKMELGKMKGQRNSGIAVWTAFGVQILVAVICATILFAGQWTHSPWLPAIAFSGFIAIAVGGYAASLKTVDALAQRKKEVLIETLCR